ncbi:ATP-binding protein [Lichenifustis flavocetrariae]|uniref:Helix-turn-helix transcriptional regulator n=1 Tax=Lichenifustis flavocetrariae TaxID=2949735 RepID=A0AA42CLF2_9HYPH|nr:winged helix-turn-helix domain-containing protein [Lichenifustis flavocetrariae]MCW6511523.1 helix-turn-helix transcriptional regulator [Lichenifustis flavocetrariae]
MDGRAGPSVDVAFVFGPYKLIPSQKLLLREDMPVKVGGRALDVLYLLVMRAGEEVSKEALIAFAWPDMFVDERNLKVHVSSLRRALEDTLPQATYIATVVRRGYQFVARVRTEHVDIAAFAGADQAAPSSLPALPTLTGRRHQVEEVAQALDTTRLVTLVGPGGVGKTSLAVAVAHARSDDFADGVHFVDLSTTHDPAMVVHLIAKSLGMRGDPKDLVSAVVDHLRDRQALIVLDNCEHLLHAAAAIAARLVDARIKGCLLATSRAPLGIAAERLQRVEPLAFPQRTQSLTAGEVLAYPAVALFALRALETADYLLADGDVQVVARLCEALDGLPLAIEIAAAKLDQFSPAEVLESVGPRLTALRNDDEGTHPRHRTLWAMLDWSYRLLSPEESTVFRLLSVFAGSFEWAEVAGMARLVAYDPYQITMALGGLVSKSLVTVGIDGEHLRYRLLESARRYAAESLLQDPLAREAQRHHAQGVLATFERSEAEWGSVENRVWRTRYEMRLGDLRKALDWCFGEGGEAALGVDLAISAIRFWNEHSFMSEQRFQVDRALSHCASLVIAPRRKAILATSRAWSMTLARQPQAETDDAWRSALACADLGGDFGQRFSVISDWAHFLIYTGRNEQAVGLLGEFIRIAAQAGDRATVFDGERLSAWAEMHLGRLTEVLAKLERLTEDLARGVPPSRITRYEEQRSVSISGTLAFSTWLTGESERALAMADGLVLQTGRAGLLMGQSHTLAFVAMPIALWSGRIDDLERYAAILRGNLDREYIALYELVQRFYAAAVRRARRQQGASDDMRSAVYELVRDGFLVRTPMYLGVLAEALLEEGRSAEADEAIEFALALQRESTENWCLPELLRVQARVMAAGGQRDLSLMVLGRARESALTIGARTLEARIVGEMARIAVAESDPEGAATLLAPPREVFGQGWGAVRPEESLHLLEARGANPRVPSQSDPYPVNQSA